MRFELTTLTSLVLACSLPAAAEPLLTHTDVFVAGTEGYFGYRIPAIETARDGSLLAFAEARKHNLSDPGYEGQDIDLVYRRSTDGGLTWSAMKVIEDPGELWSAANPATVVDRQSGRIWLLYLRCRPGRNTHTARPGTDDNQVLARFSDDHGVSWSEPMDLSRVARDWNDPKWRASVVGPGGVIQDRNGRLIAPVWKYEPFENFALFSEDRGQTWQRSQMVPGNGDENQIVELTDGRLLMDIRQSEGDRRWMSFSEDGGRTWSKPQPGNPVTPVCCAIERLTAKSAGDDLDRILWTGPQGPGRKTLVARISYDEGKTFPLEKMISEQFAAYSDLTTLPDKTVGVLWERGVNDGYEYITFTHLNREFLEFRPAQPMPADEPTGPRPYEMVWADRQPQHPPLVDFNQLDGWHVECVEGAIRNCSSPRSLAYGNHRLRDSCTAATRPKAA